MLLINKLTKREPEYTLSITGDPFHMEVLHAIFGAVGGYPYKDGPREFATDIWRVLQTNFNFNTGNKTKGTLYIESTKEEFLAAKRE